VSGLMVETSRVQKIKMDGERSKTLFLLFLLVLIYLPFITAPLFFDDLPFFARSVSSFADAPFNFGLRWFPYVSIAFTWVFAGENPTWFRLGNLFLHGMNVLLLLLLLRQWISLFVADESKEKLVAWGACLGALVFACHPLAVYGVGYLVERSILMATMFSLIMQLAYLRGLLENNKKHLVLAVAAYFLAVFSKEHSVMAPAILLPLTWLMRERIRVSLSTTVVTWVGFALVALLVVMSSKGVIGMAYEPDAASLFGQQEMLHGVHELHLLSALTQAGLFFKYCVLMVLPNPAWMSIDMRETFILSFRDWTSWLGLVAYIGYGLFALWCLFRGGRVALLGLALLYPWLLFITEFTTIRVQESFVLYRSYLWLPGFMLLLPLLVSILPEKKIMLLGGMVALLLIPLAWNRLWVFENHFRLWDDAVQLLHGEDRLGAQRTYYNRAHASAALKNWDAAIVDYQKSLAIDSSHPQVYMALSTAFYGAQRYKEALAILDKLIVQDAKNAELHFNKAMVLMKLNGKAASLGELQLSCDLGKVLACGMVQLSHLKEN